MHEEQKERRLAVFGNNQLTVIRQLEDEEYRSYSESCRWLLEAARDQQLFTMVQLNYSDYKDFLTRCQDHYTAGPLNWAYLERMMLDADRFILNYLSSIRTFLDHSQRNLVRRYGSGSPRLHAFKDSCTKAYDEHFAYRFLSKLRNYAQHCGMPVGRFSIGEEALGTTEERRVFVSVSFDRDSLLRDYDSWGPVAQELQALPPEFDVNPYVDQMMSCVKDIEKTVLVCEIPDLVRHATVIQRFVAQTEGVPGTPCVAVVTPTGEDELNVNLEWPPVHLVKRYLKPYLAFAERASATSETP